MDKHNVYSGDAKAKYTVEFKLVAVSVSAFDADRYQETLRKAKG